MDVPLMAGSNILSLIVWVLGHGGVSFAEKCEATLRNIDARMAGCNGEEWHRLLRTKGQVEGFIRHDRDTSLDWYGHERAAAA